MRTWDEAIKNALRMYTQREKYVYLYGAKGTKLNTRADIEYFFRADPKYFARYSAEEKEQIIRNSLGKTAYDCSGFVGWACTGDKQYSTGQYGNNKFKTQNLASGIAGSCLYTTYGGAGRHIGIDIGYGYCCDMAYESTDANIAVGRAGVRLYKIMDGICPWEWSFQSKVIDYTGADAR